MNQVIMQSKVGLVLAGGGGKGAYQIGVLKALDQLGIAQQVEVVAGTSVGALNAALFAQGDLSRTEQTWLDMAPNDVLHLDIEKVTKHAGQVITNTLLHQHGQTLSYFLKSGLFTRKGLERMIDTSLDHHALKNTNLRCFANCTKVSLGFHKPFQAEYFPLHGKELAQIRQILLASSAIPGVFGQEEIDGAKYWDGFITDNLPIRPVYDTGCDIIIVVMLERDTRINPKQFPEATLIPIAPSEDPGHPLNFKRVAGKIDHGYRDAWQALAGAVQQNALRERGRELMAEFLQQLNTLQANHQLLEEQQHTLAENEEKINALRKTLREKIKNRKKPC